MEPIRPPTGPAAPQAVAHVTPVGRGWMLLVVEAGFVLRNASQGLDLRLAPEDAEALRRGEVTPEALAARAGQVHQPPPGAVTVAFSAEAMRLSGRMDLGNGQDGSREKARGKAGDKAGPQRPVPVPPLPLGWIGAGCLALLVLVMILTA